MAEYYKKKFDEGKTRWNLLSIINLVPIVKVLEYGLIDHGVDSWKEVPDAEVRYTNALIRHLAEISDGKYLDSESNLPHLWHVACNVYFLLYFDRKQNEGA